MIADPLLVCPCCGYSYPWPASTTAPTQFALCPSCGFWVECARLCGTWLTICPVGVCEVHHAAMERTNSGGYLCAKCVSEGRPVMLKSLTADQRKALARWRRRQATPPSKYQQWQAKHRAWLVSLPEAKVVGEPKPFVLTQYTVGEKRYYCADPAHVAREEQRGKTLWYRCTSFQPDASYVIAKLEGKPRWFRPAESAPCPSPR